MPELAIWILEDEPRRAEAMLAALRIWAIGACVFRTACEFNAAIASRRSLPAIVSLDHDLNVTVPAGDPASGMDVVDLLLTLPLFARVIIHSSNVTAAAVMRRRLRDAGWHTVAIVPSDDVAWVERDWAAHVERAIRAEVACDPDDVFLSNVTMRRTLHVDNGVVLGVIDAGRVLTLYEAAPRTDRAAGRFAGHHDVATTFALGRREIDGGFSLLIKDRELFAFCRRSELNRPADDFLLPMQTVDATMNELSICRHPSFRVYA